MDQGTTAALWISLGLQLLLTIERIFKSIRYCRSECCDCAETTEENDKNVAEKDL